MTIIRGATTIAHDEITEIREAVRELLVQIENTNGLKRDEILSIVFSSTSDIHSYYPAKAAREAGFETASLFSAMEPEINGGLKLCIRVMLFVEKNIAVHHVYLREAKALRKDISQKMNVAIDGPAGSGKSTIAKRLAEDYKILYLDTGAMYRACALQAVNSGINVESESALYDLMSNLPLDIVYQNGKQITLLDGKDVSDQIREPRISMAASTVSKHKCVRMKMVEKQREIARETSCVLDGRDIGTYVLPDADFKFFLTASADVRAKRRYLELKEKGHDVDYDELKAEIVKRDEQDANREFAPLKQASDAVFIDTSDMTIEEVVTAIKSKIQERI